MDDKQLIENFNMIIHSTIMEGNYSMEHICSSIFLSRSQLHRRIKSITGYSTTNYIRKVRLQKAKEVLTTERSMKINEVAIIVGINSAQNFSKYFKEEFGMTPSSFRKNHTNLFLDKDKYDSDTDIKLK